MKTYFFFSMCAVVLVYLLGQLRRSPSRAYASVDAIVPAYNEEPCIEQSLRVLLNNPYIARVICVNDGSTDRTLDVLNWMAQATPRLVVIDQANSGKGGAIMHGLMHVTAPYVFLTDADTYVPTRGDGLGHLIAEIERGADAVGGIPSSNLARAGLLPHIRATVKLPMIVAKRTFQQLLGGAPFIISGACGMFKAEVLRSVGLTDRTKVEDLDLTWTLVSQGYRVRQASRCIVYPQECNSIREEWLRWRRWITGYAVCMRLHWRLLFSRFGVFSILPMFLVVVIGIALHAVGWANAIGTGNILALPLMLFPLLWVLVVTTIGLISAVHHRRPWLVPLSPFAVLYVLLAYAVWAVHGVAGLLTGREPKRDKPTRNAHVVA